MKRNIYLFKSFLASFLLFIGSNVQISATEAPTAVAMEHLDSIDISLLTCQPHDEVYSLYGHTALRIEDHTTGTDIAVNYGVFDTTKDYFVLRFILGLTDYMMATYSFTDFLAEYRYYGSGVYQQRLNLTAEQKARMLMTLAENSKPENVVYRYNFYYNNCTTRIRDIILESSPNEKILCYEGSQTLETFRDLIHEKNNSHPWARFGNDMLLGVASDFNASSHEKEFIPDRLMSHLEWWRITNGDGNTTRPMIDSAYWALQPGAPYHPAGNDFPFTPLQCSIILLCVVMALVAVERIVVKKILAWIYFCITFFYGVIGLLLFIMIFSKHPTVNINLQILIFNPLTLYLTFPKTKWKYRWHTVLAMCLLFFIGNTFQQYAEGTNIMALVLCIIASNSLLYSHTVISKPNKSI